MTTTALYALDATAPPLDMLASVLAARRWQWQIVSTDEIHAQIVGNWTTYDIRAVWRDEDAVLQLFSLPDIRVSISDRGRVADLLARVNEQVWLGHFELWSRGNVIVYRHAAMLGDGGLLGLAQAQSLLENAIDECDRFYPAFQFLLWGGRSPEAALAAAVTDVQGRA